MKIEEIDVYDTIEKAKQAVESEKNMASDTKRNFNLLIDLVTILVNRLNLNSRNSSKPPSTDHTGSNQNKRKKSSNKPGGQKGHNGVTLEQVSDPDEIKYISIDRRTLPTNNNYQVTGYDSRQVVNIKISKTITEYRAEILTDSEGNVHEITWTL